MQEPTFDPLTPVANALRDRRRTLRGLGIGAIAAAVARPSLVKAGKGNRKTTKRIKRKCKRQIDACRASLTALCTTADCEEDSLANLLTCCPLLASCKAGASLDCFFSTLN